MREIKFRGLSINGDWSYGLLAHTEHKDVACGDTGYFISNKAGCAFAYQVRPETVGQYTGLKDKNGKEIYEGDILFDSKANLNCDIKWSDENWGWVRDYRKMWLLVGEIESTEVIGNIHDSPELLN